MDAKEKYIAVFDSGVGGISVLRELVKQMPGEHYLYYGDSANAPYGNRPTEQIRELTLAAAEYLFRRGIKALVVACNTATSAAIGLLREKHPDALIIGIEPALKPAVDRFPTGRIGVMATRATLREEKFAQQLERFPQVRVDLIPAPGLVPLIEAGKTSDPQTLELLTQLLGPYRGKLDALVLGCTHYPFVKNAISSILGPDVLLLDGGAGTARQTHRLLKQNGLLLEADGSVLIENSSADPALIRLCAQLLEEDTDA